MKGRLALPIAATLALVAGIAVGANDSGGSAQAASAAQRPNVVVLETDDQTLAEMEVLPNVRRLIGDQGVTFENNFDSFSLCCPSRASFLTGQYSHNNGVRGNSPPDGGFEQLDSSNTLAVWLQRSGYYTIHLGKYLNGYGRGNPTLIPAGWSEWHGAVDPTTYRYYDYTLNEGGSLHTFCATPQPSCYQTDVYRDKANEIISRRAKQGPFFLWVAFLGDHSGGPREPDDPLGIGTPVPAPRHKDKLKGTPLPQPPSFNEADVSDKPQIIKRRPLLNAGRIAAIQENWQQRRETLMSVDEAVASIVETLRQTGELDNTLILFTSDNGFFHGEHRVESGKVLWYEPSIHLPLLMRWTGNRSLPRGVHRSQLVLNVDDAETILDAANVTAGRIEDGTSLLPLWRDGGKELGDPYELQSEHSNPAYEPLRAALAARLHGLVTCAGAGCRARPAVRLTAARQGLCGLVTAIASGPGVASVTFLVDGRRVATDSRAPFRATLRFKKRSVVRARVTVAFDRLVTLDRVVRACR